MRHAHIIILFITFFCIACKSQQDSSIVNIHQEESTYPIIIWIYRNYGDTCISTIEFPLVFKISKNIFGKIELKVVEYNRIGKYIKGRPFWNTNAYLLFKEGENLIRPKGTDKIRSIKKKEKEIIVYVPYYNIAENKDVQKLYKSYIERAEAEDKDTLHIESIQQLKQINPDLVNEFLQSDSIRFVLHYDNKYHTITLPVEVK